MNSITAIKAGRGHDHRVSVFLDNRLRLRLATDVVAAHGLRIGQELSPDQVESLRSSERIDRCYGYAARLLRYRPRSEFELRDRLNRHGFQPESIHPVITRLKEEGLIDDVAFARFWQENRDTFSPRSRWLTRTELLKKGVAPEIAEQVINDSASDDEDAAYRVASGRSKRLPLTDYQTFYRRLGNYLKRRGFGYGIINHTVKRLWEEMGKAGN